MAIQIFSVSSSVNIENEWQAVINYFDLADKGRALKKLSPLPEIPRLPIGARIEDDLTISKSTKKTERVVFSNFNAGGIISIEELPNSLYPFNVSWEVVKDTKLYLVGNSGMKPYVFFCYEVFRTFLCLDNRIIPYLFQYDVLESFINAEEITEVDGFKHLYLELNDNFPKKLLRDRKFIENYIYILYNAPIRKFWKSIQAKSSTKESDFSFNSIEIQELDIVCRVKEYQDFKLVYNIEAINSNLEMPFDELILVHSSFFEKDTSKQNKRTKKKGCFDETLPTSHSTENNTTDYSDFSERVSVLPLSFSFDRKIDIKKLKRLSDTDSSSSESRTENTFPKLNLGERTVGLHKSDNKEAGESQFLSLTRDEGFNIFDYSEIPEGLVFFSKAIDLMGKRLEVHYTYEVWYFGNNSSFGHIEGVDRKALIIKIPNTSPIYIIEIDSSDDRFISTLMLTNLTVSNSDRFFEMLLDRVEEGYGVWPEEFLSRYCDYAKIKHPKITKKLKHLPEKKRNEIYIKNFARKIIRVLV